jgi:pimeloyl-ACP methyl ester carboxylesterase
MKMNADLLQTPPEAHFAAVNGMQMYYEVHGAGTPLVLLHGTPSSGRSWQTFIPHFAEHYRVIVPDFRGYGHSTNPQNDWTHRQLALDVLALLDQLKIEEFKAMGMSSGAITLLHMATQQPSRLASMVLIGAGPYTTEQSRTLVQEWILDSPNWNWEELRLEHVYGDAQIQAIIEGLHDYVNRHDDVAFTPPYLATISAKSLLVHGDRDEHFPVRLAVEMYTSIPNAYLWVVPNGGHLPVYDQRAPVFIQTALEFLRDNWENR